VPRKLVPRKLNRTIAKGIACGIDPDHRCIAVLEIIAVRFLSEMARSSRGYLT
jgi:hypothetical protein